MKNIALLLCLISFQLQAQNLDSTKNTYYVEQETVYLADSGSRWTIEASMLYPKLLGIDEPKYSGDNNFGLNIGTRYYLHPHYALRSRLELALMQHEIKNTEQHTSVASLNVDFMAFLNNYHSTVRPYLVAGGAFNLTEDAIGGTSKLLKFWKHQPGISFNLGAGTEIKLTDKLAFKTELYHILHSNSWLDDLALPGGKKGVFNNNADSWANLQLGLVWKIGKKKIHWNYGQIISHNHYSEVQHYHTVQNVEPAEFHPIEEPTVQVQIQQHQILDLDNMAILFDFDSDEIKPQAWPILNQVAELLNHLEYDTLIIRGWADCVGTEEYNQQLSERRAQAVAKYLSNKNPYIVYQIQGMGISTQYNNQQTEGRQWNRCVKFELIL